MNTHPETGFAGLQILNPDGNDQESISYQYLSQRYTSGKLSGLPGKIAAVMGAAMIAPREAINTIGGFDGDFFSMARTKTYVSGSAAGDSSSATSPAPG